MALGAKTIRIKGFDEIELVLWVNRYGEQTISIDASGDDHYSVKDALAIAKGIQKLADWAKTKAGQKKLKQFAAKEYKQYYGEDA